ncbi:MAG: MazG family protein [Clostridia bacterium]|nr:MazG family protein [Clostridia bacterium]
MKNEALKFKNKEHYSSEDLYEILTLLRQPDGCPWDRVQTHQSVRRGIIEEAYEAAEAIDRDDAGMMSEEFGDLLMQVYFHAVIGEEEGSFTLQDIYDSVCKKLIFRHPHIFADAPDASGSSEEGWLAIKRLEKGQKNIAEELEGIAKTLPSLTRAEKFAGRLYPHESKEPLYEMLEKQIHRLKSTPDAEHLGAALFTLCRLAKVQKIDPEEALEREITKKIPKKQ